MPIYEYRCEDCEQIFEEWQKNFEEKQACCPVCGSNAERIISNTSFILKGSGWYVTDYCDRKPSGNGNGSSGKATEAAGSSESAGNGASTESKPAAQAPPAAKDTKKPAETKKADTSSKSSTTGTS